MAYRARMRLTQELSQLIFPTRCFGCNRIGLAICSDCRSEWHPHYYLTHVSSLKVHSAVVYSPTARKILLAAKENGIHAADNLIIDSIIHVLSMANFTGSNIFLVPIPSSSMSKRRRGRSFVVDIVERIAQQTSLPMNNSLHLIRPVRDQSRLRAVQRSLNVDGAMSLKPGVIPRADLVLIDDVVTTGATLREAARALTAAGCHVIGSVTACVAQPLR